MLGDLLFEGVALVGEWILDGVFGGEDDDKTEEDESDEEDE